LDEEYDEALELLDGLELLENELYLAAGVRVDVVLTGVCGCTLGGVTIA
jgi:hypothetical protein